MWQDSFGPNKWGLVYKISRSYIRSHLVISPWLLPNSINFQKSVGIGGALFSDNPSPAGFWDHNTTVPGFMYEFPSTKPLKCGIFREIRDPHGLINDHLPSHRHLGDLPDIIYHSHLRLLKLASSVSAMCISWWKSWLITRYTMA